MRRNEGFTLVELLVSFTVGAIVALAATSVLLLGLRFNAISSGGAQRQNTTRILLAVLEGVASDGTMTKVESDLQSWAVHGENGIILSYDDKTDAIYSGTNKLLEGVIASHISLTDNLLTVSVETEDGSYSSTIYCRMVEDDEYVQETLPSEIEDIEDAVNPGDNAVFLQHLMSQYPRGSFPNIGVIFDETHKGTGVYYATWYAETKNLPNTSDWNSETPWCACFVSWAMWKTKPAISTDNLFANVDDFMNYMKPLKTNAFIPGDVIFFDWNDDEDPEHVGVILLVEGDYVYTIEGNSADVVALRMYRKDDSCIIGAGTLDWD